MIQEEFGVEYSPKRPWSLLRELGLSWQRPRRRAKERDEISRYIWLTDSWPEIKKTIKGTILVFLDESGFSSTPYVAKTWAPRGQTPIIRHPFNWEKLSAISAITSHPGLYFRLHKGKTIRKEQVVQFLKLLLCHIRGLIILLWYGAPQHRKNCERVH